VVWLYADPQGRVPKAVRDHLDEAELRISPMVLLELRFLREIGRINPLPEEILGYLRARLGLRVCDLPFADVVEGAAAQAWTRDPFDRVIVGHAARAAARLVTADTRTLDRYEHSFWA
jgi:PIN domain nuclease of toxin-antitoxin system